MSVVTTQWVESQEIESEEIGSKGIDKASRHFALPNNDLDRPLALARYLLMGVEAFAQSLTLSYGFGLLDNIELPPIVRDEADVAQLQAVAPLYLAAELEAAQLVPAVELVAALFISGGLRLEDEAASAALYAFWQRRHERFSQEERQAIFARLFGATILPAVSPAISLNGDANTEFEFLLLALAEAFVQTEANPLISPNRPPNVPISLTMAAISGAAERLIENILPRSGGITAFASREIIATVGEALTVMKMRAVQASLGAATLWPAVQASMLRYRQRQIRALPHVQRGKSGLILMTWLAESAPQLGLASTSGGEPFTLPAEPVFAAAAAWLRASATLHNIA